MYNIKFFRDDKGNSPIEEYIDELRKKANKSKLEIFTEISDKIHRVTLQDDIFCQIVVSYFIQSCEVF